MAPRWGQAVVCGVVPVATIVPVLLPGAYHTGTIQGPLLHVVHIILDGNARTVLGFLLLSPSGPRDNDQNNDTMVDDFGVINHLCMRSSASAHQYRQQDRFAPVPYDSLRSTIVIWAPCCRISPPNFPQSRSGRSPEPSPSHRQLPRLKSQPGVPPLVLQCTQTCSKSNYNSKCAVSTPVFIVQSLRPKTGLEGGSCLLLQCKRSFAFSW